MINADTDFGPRVSFELNSLFPNSLVDVSNHANLKVSYGEVLQNFV